MAHRGGDDPDRQPALDRRHPLHLHLVRAQLRGLRRRRSHLRRAHGRRCRRGRRPDGLPDPPAGRRLASAAARVHPDLRRRPLERGLRCRLSDPRPARRRGVRERGAASVGRHGRVFRRRRGDLHGQPHPHADRRHADRDHQRGDRHGRRRNASHDRGQLLVQHRVIDRPGAGRRDRHRADRRTPPGPLEASLGQWAERHRHRGRGRRRAGRRRRQEGSALRAVRVPRVPGAGAADHDP